MCSKGMLSWIWADGYHGKPGADYNGLIDAIFYDEAMPRGRIVERKGFRESCLLGRFAL